MICEATVGQKRFLIRNQQTHSESTESCVNFPKESIHHVFIHTVENRMFMDVRFQIWFTKWFSYIDDVFGLLEEMDALLCFVPDLLYRNSQRKHYTV